MAAGRLFQSLEKDVLGPFVGPVEPFDDHHATLAGDRCAGALGEPAASRGNDARAAGAGLAPACRRPDDQVRVGARPRITAPPAEVAWSRGAVGGGAQQESEEIVHECALVGTGRTVYEQRALHPIANRGLPHDGLRGHLTEAAEALLLLGIGHRASIGIEAGKPGVTVRSGRLAIIGRHAPPGLPWAFHAGGRLATGPAASNGGARRGARRGDLYFGHRLSENERKVQDGRSAIDLGQRPC